MLCKCLLCRYYTLGLKSVLRLPISGIGLGPSRRPFTHSYRAWRIHLRPFVLNSYKLRIVYALKRDKLGEISWHTQRIYRGRTEYAPYVYLRRGQLWCPVCNLGSFIRFMDEFDAWEPADYSKRTPQLSCLHYAEFTTKAKGRVPMGATAVYSEDTLQLPNVPNATSLDFLYMRKMS